MAKKWRFWIDRGGTFTDVIAVSPSGQAAAKKTLAGPRDGGESGLAAAREFLGIARDARISSAQVTEIRIGTTLATNALLERDGEPTALAITRGFGDALIIGYQNRPRIFSPNAHRPPPLFFAVAEIDERIGARGGIVRRLNEKSARASLIKIRQRGCNTLAIALMHGYRHPNHEKQIAKIARAIGFANVVCSHEVAAMMKLIPRGDTAVAEAYLSPRLAAFVSRLRDEVESGVRILFMQSGGSLASADSLMAKDAVLSGPAGGAIATAYSSAIIGGKKTPKVVGLDMGGTSADVCHFAGEFERALENEIGGVRLYAPMLSIHTVASGGGSIAQVHDGRLTVGPQSAGASPGPACYRGGGPLTITDCNVLLGRLRPEFFPDVFGGDGNLPLDDKVVARKFNSMAKKASFAIGKQLSPPQAAEGFLRISAEAMAGAIRRITVARGFDVRSCVLNAFGGAAGQHACAVADLLEVRKVLVRRFAGALSAWGIGVADVGVIRHSTIEIPLEESAACNAILNSLEKQARKELSKEGGDDDEKVTVTRRLYCRYDGAEARLAVASSSFEKMRREFESRHRRRFGYCESGRKIVAALAEIEAMIKTPMPPPERKKAITHKLSDAILSREEVYFGGEWHITPFYAWEKMPGNSRISGPAVIVMKDNTVVAEKNWKVQLLSGGDLLLSRAPIKSPKRIALMKKPDPALIEVFNHRFMAIAEEMGEVLRAAASSVNIRERLDFSCALFDGDGALIANAPHIPVHLGSMSETVRALIRLSPSGLNRGDVYMQNSPYAGGTHLPDVTVIKPIRFSGKKGGGGIPDCFVAARGHHADIGGISPGSMPAASRRIEEEGALIDFRPLIADGKFMEKDARIALTNTKYPARNPNQNIADLKAQAAACAAGERALLRAAAEFGAATVRDYFLHIRKNAEGAARRLIKTLPEGEFKCELDDGAIIKVAIKINRKRGDAVFDFSGTSSMHSGNFNAPSAVVRAAVIYCLRALLGEDIPLNDGLMRPVKLRIPRGSLLSPRPPSAVVAGNVETSQIIADAIFAALGKIAASQGTCNNFTFGAGGGQYYETICGGGGASREADGISASQVHMTNSRLTDPEVLEWRYPVLVEEFSIRKGSGGGGKKRGGDGAIRRIKFLESGRANILSGRRKVAPHGICGGSDGECGENSIVRANGEIEKLGGAAESQMSPGDIFVIKTPGGGGFGGDWASPNSFADGGESAIIRTGINIVPAGHTRKDIK